MAVHEDYILAMSQGTSWLSPKGTAAPTGMATPTTPWVDLGGMSTDGLTETMSQTRTDFKRWGNISIFKSVITDQKHQFKVKFLENNVNVLGLFYRVAAPTPDATTHIVSVTDDITGARISYAMLFDVLDGTNHARFYLPNAEVTDVDAPVYKTDGLVEYGVTITAHPSSAGVAVARTFLLDAVVAGE